VFKSFRAGYPPQLWVLFWGTLFSSLGLSLVWPFLTIDVRERLDVPLTTITLLFTLQSIAGLVATTIISPLMDRFGRKWAMMVGLLASGVSLLAMSRADTLAAWAFLLPAYAMVNTMFRIGSYAMVADTIAPDRRADVYALLRMGDNVGIAFGPAVGGFLFGAAQSLAYVLAGSSQFILMFFVLFLLSETLIRARSGATSGISVLPGGAAGYGPMLRDRPFLSLWGLYILIQVAASMVFILLGLYVKENYGITESRYGLIIGTNAVMVVVLQYPITRFTQRYPPLRMIAAGALLYAAGMGVFALSRNFGSFMLGMIVFTLGELSLVPTATALVANIAPADMRARYMGIFSLSFRIGAGIGPVIGGVLSDTIAPVATWIGGVGVCLVAALGFWLLARSQTLHTAEQRPAAQPETTGAQL